MFNLIFPFISFSLQSSRSKRYTPNENDFKIVKNNLFVELLVVLDSTVFEFFRDIYRNFDNSLINDYVKVFFCHVINGVNKINNLSYLIITL